MWRHFTLCIGHIRDGFLWVKWPNQQCQSTEGSSNPKDRLQSHQVHLTMIQYYNMQYTVMHKIHTYIKMNLSTVKWAQWDKTQSRELLGLFICVCIALCTIVAHSTAQNRPDNFPYYLSDSHHWILWDKEHRFPMYWMPFPSHNQHVNVLRKLKALTSTKDNHPLASSFLHPLMDSWGMGRSSLYASFTMPVP